MRVCAIALLVGCATPVTAPDAGTPACTGYGAAEFVARLEGIGDETSGLAASALHDGVFWTHDDSGGAPVLRAVGLDGSFKGALRIDGATNVDWEDVGVGPCSAGASVSCVFVADVGDNEAIHAHASIYVVREPATLDIENEGNSAPIRTIAFTYDTGAHDVEALLVDPATADLLLVEKRPYDDAAPRKRRVHRLSTTAEVANPIATFLTTFVVPGDDDSLVTGGAMRPDGRAFVLRTYGNTYEFPVPERGAFVEAFARPPTTLARIRTGEGETEVQGEALTYARDGRAVFTTSEGKRPPLNVRRCVE